MRSLRACAAAFLLSVGLVACGGSDGSSEKGTADPDATLNTANVIATETLDPHMIQNELVFLLSAPYLAYDQLFVIGPDGKPTGRLVTDWSTSKDGKAVTLKLREGVSFRDGGVLNAEVVAKNLERARTLQSPLVKAQMSSVAKSEAAGDYEVTVTLNSPSPVLPYVLAGGAGYIMNPALFEKGDPAAKADGSGAYQVESFTPREKVVYVRDRDDYWDAEAGKFKSLVHRAIPDPTALSNAVASGQVDLAQMQPSEIAGLKGLPNVEINHGGQAYGVDLYLNFTGGALTDPKVRQAVNHAIDRKAIVDAMFPGSEPRWQQARKGLGGFDPALENAYPHDVARAKELLKEAGHENGVDIGEILVSSVLPPGLEEIIKAELGEAGIEVDTRRVDSLQVYQFWLKGEAAGMLAYSSYGLEYSLGAATRWNAMQPGDMPEELTGLLGAAADSRLPDADRDAGYQKVSGHLSREALSAPLVWVTYPWPTSDRVIGFDPSRTNYNLNIGPHDYRHLSVTK